MASSSTLNGPGPRRANYREAPDFTRPLLDIPAEANQRIFDRLSFLYGADVAHDVIPELIRLLRVHHAHKKDQMIEVDNALDAGERFSERDLILITYGDMVRAKGSTALAALGDFMRVLSRRTPVFNTLHILPFFPYSSDRGFSVTDFRSVDPNIGTWGDIAELGRSFRLMFDGVVNHACSKSPAFQEMLSGNPEYQDFAFTFESRDDLTPEHRNLLRRPRTSDILTQFQSIRGPIWAWTTFSPDQIDLNYRNPKVLLHVVDTLLLYVRKGADLVRLDAVTYLWDEPGTPCANLEQTHEIIRLFRDVLDVAAPHVTLITETNVPHGENITYFGDGTNEAQMVYNFALPPLVLHAFYRQDASYLSAWARTLEYPSATTTYLNILDTHDGIGLPGAANILPAEELGYLIQTARQHGAFISYRSVEGGGKAPYEINSTWYSALNFDNSGEERSFQVKRFVASRSIALALRGVPAIYLHSLVGSRNDVQRALASKVKRDVNRAVLDESLLLKNLAEPGSKLNLLNDQFGRLLTTRVSRRAFHPNAAQKVVSTLPGVFSLLRISQQGDERVLAITNVMAETCRLVVPLAELGVDEPNWYDLVAGRGWMAVDRKLTIELQPYDVLWLMPFSDLERAIESGAS